MDYEQKYNKLVEAVKVLQETNPSDEGIQNWVNDNVPELAESEDERIRKYLIYCVNRTISESDDFNEISKEQILAWLEKQGQQKAINDTDEDIVKAVKDASILDMVGPKFKVGDWVVHDISDGKKVIRQIINMTNKSYLLDGEDFNTFYFNDLENDYHLWTIQDAKDGDVLATDDWVFIFEKLNTDGKPICYCHYDIELGFVIDVNTYISTGSYIRPATKEERDLLFQKMYEAVYTFDFEKKELKKIEQKPAWSDKDDSMFQSCIGAVATNDYYKGEEKEQIYDWLKTLKQRIGG